jgi:MerR family mercuric resistance operon transcriptional regulator
MTQTLTIGKLATAAGVHVETIRYYQRCGLLAEPPKPLGGQRHYPAAAVERLQFIKRAQALGFTLAEISDLLSLDGTSDCQQASALARHKLALVRQKMADLAAIRCVLESLISQCEQNPGQQHCPVIAEMAGIPCQQIT